jgi:ribosomal protein L16 Arg81 hydroxylase
MQNPYMRDLARQGIDLHASFGIMHPSQTNYISTVAGELCNVTSDNRTTRC